MYTYEIYLTKKYITKEEWLEFIKIISNFVGVFKNWQIIVVNNQNKLQYFTITDRILPPTINKLDAFLLKSTNNLNTPQNSLSCPIFHQIGSNIIDLINYNEIKNKGELLFLNINFFKIYDDKILSKTTYYLNKNNKIKKYHALLAIPANILSIDFAGNKRYFYKPVPKYLDISKVLPLLSKEENNALLKVSTFPYYTKDLYLDTDAFSFAKHSLILGSSGSGKSKFISKLVYNITQNPSTKNKYRIVIIDPHADLENDIGGLGKVIDFNYENIDLFESTTNDTIAQTELFLDLFKNIIAEQYNSKLERVLRHAINTLLIAKSFNFSNLRKIITDTEYRSWLINALNSNLPTSVINFFLSDFNELKTKSYTEAISPIISFIDELEMLPALNNANIAESLEKTISSNYLTIFSLNQTKIGTKLTKTLSGLIMSQMLTIIQKRTINEPIIFIIDEVAIIENPILTKFLSEARKYNLSLMLASQYFNQLTDNLKNAIFANTSNYYIFRVSQADATTLVDNLNIKIPLDDTKEKKIELLSNLNNRECLVRIEKDGTLISPFKATTLNYQSIPYIKKGLMSINHSKSINDSPTTTFNMNTSLKANDLIIPDYNESE